MALTKEQKQVNIKDLKEKVDKQKSMVFVDFTGLGVAKMTELRKQMRAEDCEFKVAKKSLTHLVLKDFDKEIAEKTKTLEGEIALGFGYKDEVAPFKILGRFSKQNKDLKILAGILEKEFIEQEQAIVLSNLPSRQELLAKMAGSMQSPISGFVRVLQGNIKGLICVLKQAKI
ncbi:50S ribosomal protein L10 [Candidatus Parcubacteria bacterium]|nr:50S ribosomal protein L10 [Candidatus Parcubacteria bacterium]